MTEIIDPPVAASDPSGPGADGGGGDPTAAPGDVARPHPARLAALVLGIVSLGVLFSWNLLFIILALIVSIFLHEVGHFVVARASGMLVTEFFIGMGPRLWSFRRGEVEYGVKAFPIGAYVRIVGMSNLEQVDPRWEDRTYRSKGYLRRLGTVLAGPAMNILIAVAIFYGLTASSGVVADTWTVSGVVAGSAAEAAGIEDGDRIVSIDGAPVGDFADFGDLVDELAGDPVTIVVERDGEELVLDAVLGWSLDADAAAAIPSSPALAEGTRVVSFAGEDVTSYDALRAELADPPEGATLVVEVGLDDYQLAVPEPIELPEDGARGFFGIGREYDVESFGAVDAVGETAGQLGEMTVLMVEGVGRIFSPSGLANYATLVVDSTSSSDAVVAGSAPELEPLGTSEVRSAPEPVEDRPVSIVGIVQLGSQAGDDGGLVAMLYLLAAVNLFLAFINLLPLLPFDGGHAAVATYEAIRGAIARRPYRVDMARLMPITYGVVALLLFIGLTSIWLDVRDPIQLP